MRDRLPHIMRIATIAVFAVAIVMVIRLAFVGDDSSKEPEVAEPVAGSVTVADAISGGHKADATLAVRGFLFEGGGTGVRLCPRRKPTKPPVCLGPYLDVYELDVHGLPFKSGTFLGRRVRWLDQPVTVYGKVLGTALTADSVSR
jgi:hypothetical protein